MKPGELLGLCREMKGLTLREVEKLTGISNAAISQIENNKHGLMFETAIKLCDLYGITLDRLANTIREPLPKPLIDLSVCMPTDPDNPAYGGCQCACHRMSGISHIMPCCYPEQEKPNTTESKVQS